ncbi:STAS/SEC14 domain-containing protein [Spirochaetota bacterium]
METKITHYKDEGYILFKVSGKYKHNEFIEILGEIKQARQECTAKSCNILLDTTKVEDAYTEDYIGKETAQMQAGLESVEMFEDDMDIKIAAVSSDTSSTNFGEHVATSRGMDVKVFHAMKEAIAWLLK